MSARRQFYQAGTHGPSQIGALPGSAFRDARRAVANDNVQTDRSIQADEIFYLGGLSLIIATWLLLIAI
jgi:hypothetical protein